MVTGGFTVWAVDEMDKQGLALSVLSCAMGITVIPPKVRKRRAKRQHPGRFLTPIERFWHYAEVNDVTGCWDWQGLPDPDGYAHMQVDKVPLGAHRWSYEHFVGPIPEGLVVDHLCRNRACVNWAHLEPVTQAENLRRGRIARGYAA